MHRIWFKIFGALLVAPWFIVPRPTPSTRPLDQTYAQSQTVVAHVETDASEPVKPSLTSDPWRRTSRGWELASDWSSEPPQRQPASVHRIHPWTIASLQILLCFAALLAAERRRHGARS